ncbi:MAG TPA: hypothetical protein VFR58_11095 [Flavisolibacter sp.]|nr:hypothetical protein [Flavisolibacter sp.]
MEKRITELQEQDAPGKNTDKAFVQVGEDGSPKIPEQAAEKKQPPKDAPEEQGSEERTGQ